MASNDSIEVMNPDVPLLKTCQTCFQAKIRCRSAGGSGACDRCLRLKKTCVFRPARRNYGRHERQGNTDRSEGESISDSRSPAPSAAQTVDQGPDQTASLSERVLSAASISQEAGSLSFDPFRRGLLSLEIGQELLDYFATKMTPHFPFVVLPPHISVGELIRDRTCTCLAVLAVASHGRLKLQRSLGRLLRELIASRVATGPMHCFDLLQGLVINVAWAHYQPRPTKHTQHLHLATSIICDMRLDQPRHKPNSWSVHKGKYQNAPHWDSDEMRAVAGAYYLSSSSSVLMQKSKHFAYIPYVYDYCEHLGRQAQYPTDKHLSHIIRLQKLIEDVDCNMNNMTSDCTSATADIERVKKEYVEIKVSLSFPLHESPPINMQLNLLELLLSQSSLGGSTFGVDKFHEIQSIGASQPHLLEWLSTSIAALRSLISTVLVLPPGEEKPVSNTVWFALYCCMTLAVRLDLLVAHQGPSGAAYHLRRFLDMPNTLRQIVMRCESAAGAEVDDAGDRHAFYHMANRSRRLEEWYLERINRAVAQGSGNNTTAASGGPDAHVGAMVGVNHVAGVDVPLGEGLLGTSLYYDADMNFGNVLFGDSRGYSVEFERWMILE